MRITREDSGKVTAGQKPARRGPRKPPVDSTAGRAHSKCKGPEAGTGAFRKMVCGWSPGSRLRVSGCEGSTVGRKRPDPPRPFQTPEGPTRKGQSLV